MPTPLRIGILGAAKIAPPALIEPARVVEGVEISAIAARSFERAQAFAREHAIPRVLASYAALIEDPDLDPLYNPLPAGLHAEWTIRALRAGKHVLCEKPLASNASQAEAMARAADETGRALVEAFHWRYHPLAARIGEIVRSGVLGSLERVDGEFTTPSIPADDIRFDLALGGGATMGLGCYPIHWLRFVMGAEPEVLNAVATQGPRGIDVSMTAERRFPGNVMGRMHCSMAPGTRLWAALEVQGKSCGPSWRGCGTVSRCRIRSRTPSATCAPSTPSTVRRAWRPAAPEDVQLRKGSLRTMVSSRPGPMERISIGTPTSASTRSTYRRAAAGRSSKRRRAESASVHPGCGS